MRSPRVRRGLWAGLLAALGVTACAAWCGTPIVVVIGLVGVGAAGGVLGWLPTIGVLLVAAAVLVLVLPVRRRGRPKSRSTLIP